MNVKTVTAGLAIAALAFSGAAFADPDRGYRGKKAQYDYAQVISAEPIIRYVTVKTPVRECWEETEYQVVDHGARGSAAGTLFGAIVGGVIGHQFGSGRGNDAATVAGTVIGAAIGNDASKKGPREQVRYERPVERCATTITEREEERIDGYRVVYRYNGQKYSTRMPYDPGQRLRVRVDVRPAR